MRGTVLWAGEGLAAGQLGPVCVLVWRGQPIAETFLRQKSAIEQVVEQFPGNANLFCVVEAGAPPPDDKIRKASSAMLNELSGDLRKFACVIEGSGFRAATTRLVISAITRLVRSPIPTKYFGGVAEASGWILDDPDAPSFSALAEFLQVLREELDAESSHGESRTG